MAAESMAATGDGPRLVERESLCFSRLAPNGVLHKGSDGFGERLGRLYDVAESNALEDLIGLKRRLRACVGNLEFWQTVAEGMSRLTGSQYAFVSKRILVDDQDIAVEMPPIGEPGSCLMAVGFYFNDGHQAEQKVNDLKYHAYGCPCAYMRHDKVFLIPSGLEEFIIDNPNKVATPAEAYIGIPLFSDGKCFAHFGVMWTPEGASSLKLGWGFIEMLLHSLEDLILDHMLQGTGFPRPEPLPRKKAAAVVPHEAITVSQSLKPYARNLSHELRTPMQGVVGMLDVMYATVQEAAEGQADSRVRAVFQTLKEHIEIVQDSSRRAVEAADNVVHAYDMDMAVPESPSPLSPARGQEARNGDVPTERRSTRPEIVIAGSDTSIETRKSRKRRHSLPCGGQCPSKRQATAESWSWTPPRNDTPSSALRQDGAVSSTELAGLAGDLESVARQSQQSLSSPGPDASARLIAPGLRHTNLRDVLRYVVNDSLKVGGRPESAVARETEYGEIIEVVTKRSDGDRKSKVIEWAVDANVPATMLVDERDLGKMISCVFLNAIKFTEEGYITLKARASANPAHIIITIKDTGPGIPPAFRPKLFKAFSREDDSLTRQSEGLGLGLMVAKGVARKLGGDLLFIRSDSSGPNKGSEFEMRIPVVPGNECSRCSSPFGSPALPAIKSRQPSDADVSLLEQCNAPNPGSPVPAPNRTEPLKTAARNGSAAASSSRAAGSIPIIPIHPVTEARRHLDSHNRHSSGKKSDFDRGLAKKHPLTFLVVEDNRINRKLLVNMLQKLGYRTIYEAYDGAEAVRQMAMERSKEEHIDVVLMDLWMPFMDGYEATERILEMERTRIGHGGHAKQVTILAVSADVTDSALEQAGKVGIKGFMTKPYKLMDLERLIVEHCLAQDIEGQHHGQQ